jgi:hypothetical protein
VIDWSLSDEDNLAQLVEVVSKPTGRLVTFGDIARDLGDHAYGVIVRVFMVAQQADPGLVPAFSALSTVGMILDTPSRSAMIDHLSTAGYGPSGLEPWPAEWVAKIKAMGVTTGPRWQIELGFAEAPTLESIAAARLNYQLQLEAAAREAAAAANAAAFAAVREQWVAAYSAALQFIGRIEATGDAPPTLDAILHHIGRS